MKNLRKSFLMTSKNIERSSAFWNMAGSMLSAFQSVIMLIVLSRVVSDELVGIYTMGNVSANLFLFIGKYGMRGFQVSDVKNIYSFKDYHMTRVISSIMMIIVSVVYTLYSAHTVGYTSEKTQIIIWMCLMRVPEAYEDVYHGDYQKKGRLDVGAKCLTIRVAVTLVLLGALVVITGNLLSSLIIATIFTYVFMVVLLYLTRDMLDQKNGKGVLNRKNVTALFIAVFPIFLAMFLSNYLGAAPKNSIDRFMDDSIQAIYGYISMPVFVVGLLASVIFNPILLRTSCMWNEGKFKDFLKTVFQQAVYVLGITVVCLIGAYLLGVPVLSFMYNKDLAPYKTDLLLIVVGSGFLAMATLFMNILTIMREQKLILAGYIIVAAAAFLLSDKVVLSYEMRGAVWFYVILLAALSVFYGAAFGIKYKKYVGGHHGITG